MLEATISPVIRELQSLNLVAYLTMENLALRQQLMVLKRRQKRTQLNASDRAFWEVLSKIWSAWRDALVDFSAGYCRPMAQTGVQALLAAQVPGR